MSHSPKFLFEKTRAKAQLGNVAVRDTERGNGEGVCHSSEMKLFSESTMQSTSLAKQLPGAAKKGFEPLNNNRQKTKQNIKR